MRDPYVESLVGGSYDATICGQLQHDLEAKTREMNETAARHKEVTSKSFTGPDAANRQVEANRLQSILMVQSLEHSRLATALQRMRDIRPVSAQEKKKMPAFTRFLLRGEDGLSKEEREACITNDEDGVASRVKFGITDTAGQTRAEVRGRQHARLMNAPQRSDTGDLSPAVPTEVVPTVIETLAHIGDVESVAYTFVTPNGRPMTYPGADGSAEEGQFIDQTSGSPAGQATEDNFPDLDHVDFPSAYLWTTGAIDIRREAMEDIAFGFEDRALQHAVRRYKRGWTKKFIKGTGTNQPQGIEACATLNTANTSANTTIDIDDVNDLLTSVDPAYDAIAPGKDALEPIAGGDAAILMSHAAYRILFRMKDGDGRPLWAVNPASPGLTMAERPGMSLRGYPFRVINGIDGMGSGKKPMFFGNFSYYGIRTVKSMTFQRYDDSPVAAQYSVRFMGFCRRDARALGALSGGKCEAIRAMVLKA